MSLIIEVAFGRLKSNKHIYHPENPESMRFEQILGPKFRYCRLESFEGRTSRLTSCGHRVWFYFPSGACWHIDWEFRRTK